MRVRRSHGSAVEGTVVQGEAVMHGDQVHRGGGAPPGPPVQVGGAGEPGRELTQSHRLAAPEVAHAVAVLAVPLTPQRREPAQVVTVQLADIPGLSDQLGLGHHRILGDQVEEGGRVVEAAFLPGQGRGEVEPEPVHVHLGQPVAQRVHHQLEGARVARVERVAGAGRVEVEAGVVVVEAVVDRVVQTAEAQRRAQLVALGAVVENYVENDLQAGPVQRVDHGLELGDLAAGPAGPHGGGVPVAGREEPDRVVAPVVGQAAVGQHALGHELVHRQQLDGGDPQVGQVPDGRLVP